MKMKKYQVKIKGVTPYMQHRMDDIKLEEWEKKRGRIIERDDVSKEDQIRAEYHSYFDDKGKYIPAEHIRASLIEAGAYIKSKVGNSKKSMKNIVAAMFFINQEKIYLENDYVIDKRSAVNKNIKARVIVIRPKWDKWEATFELMVDNDTITDETVEELLTISGQYCGIGSFRPTNNGMFGRYKIEQFEKIIVV
jgi:hypothetical protein